MAFFGLFGDSPGDNKGNKRLIKVQAKKIETLEKSVTELHKVVLELESRLQETQLIVQYIAQANNALATDMSTIYESLQSVMNHFSQDPFEKWGLKSWGFDDDDDDDNNGGSGGGWLN